MTWSAEAAVLVGGGATDASGGGITGSGATFWALPQNRVRWVFRARPVGNARPHPEHTRLLMVFLRLDTVAGTVLKAYGCIPEAGLGTWDAACEAVVYGPWTTRWAAPPRLRRTAWEPPGPPPRWAEAGREEKRGGRKGGRKDGVRWWAKNHVLQLERGQATEMTFCSTYFDIHNRQMVNDKTLRASSNSNSVL